jgi:hypothetical protein
MGNRAVLQLNDSNLGIYLHWNGGRDSVEGFLLAAKQVMADRLGDKNYGAARLVQVITTFIGGNLSVGLGTLDELACDNMDNGLYVIDTTTMSITDRKYYSGPEQKGHSSEEIADIIIKKINGDI